MWLHMPFSCAITILVIISLLEHQFYYVLHARGVRRVLHLSVYCCCLSHGRVITSKIALSNASGLSMYRWWPALGIRISAVGTVMVLRAFSPAFQSIQSLSPSKKSSIEYKKARVNILRNTCSVFVPSSSFFLTSTCKRIKSSTRVITYT